jgi:hypothetical protein
MPVSTIVMMIIVSTASSRLQEKPRPQHSDNKPRQTTRAHTIKPPLISTAISPHPEMMMVLATLCVLCFWLYV